MWRQLHFEEIAVPLPGFAQAMCLSFLSLSANANKISRQVQSFEMYFSGMSSGAF